TSRKAWRDECHRAYEVRSAGQQGKRYQCLLPSRAYYLFRDLVGGVLRLLGHRRHLSLWLRSKCRRIPVLELYKLCILARGIHAPVSPCPFEPPEVAFPPRRRSTVRRIPVPRTNGRHENSSSAR